MATALRYQTVIDPSNRQDDADVALAARGDRQAFERLYRQHVNRIFSLCARMVGDRTRAEELTQDAFVRAWEKLEQFRGESAFGTWLHRLAVNVVLNDRQTENRRRGRQDESVEDVDTMAHESVRAAVSPALSIDLERAIAGLPPGARKVFVLHDVEGYTHDEIGGMLGVTAGGCKAQLHRARLLLREALNA
jgi:RNA polymerase sigma-70 factor (ECF subfamily)